MRRVPQARRISCHAHAAHLVVHVWTVRVEREFLPAAYPDAAAEFTMLRDLGVDGVFTDFPDIAVKTYRQANSRF